MQRFKDGTWIVQDIGNFAMMIGAILFAIASVYCSFAIAFACQLTDDFEAIVSRG